MNFNKLILKIDENIENILPSGEEPDIRDVARSFLMGVFRKFLYGRQNLKGVLGFFSQKTLEKFDLGFLTPKSSPEQAPARYHREF